MSSIARSVVALALITSGLSACSSNGAGPEVRELRVVVLDDAGAPVDRMPFTVSADGGQVVTSRTNGRGEATVSVPDAGSYDVQVTPRAGYLSGTDPLRKSVDVNESGLVRFTVFRESAGDNPRLPCPECTWGR